MWSEILCNEVWRSQVGRDFVDDLLLVWRLEKRIVFLNASVDKYTVKFRKFRKNCLDIVLQIGEVR